jgi:parvulin-like peptidyl-prolyl isomerase
LAQKILSENPDIAQTKEKITQAKSELESGKDFAEVARKYSDGSSKENGGELGWVDSEQVVPELKSILFDGQSYKKNDIIESSIGFHIVEIENKKNENGKDLLQLRQIFVAKYAFVDWLVEQKKQMRVWVPLRTFTWDSKMGTIDFRDEEMRTFEKEERVKAQGDASIMF